MEKKISELLNIGEKIEIEIDNEESFLKMKSTVVRVISDSEISVTIPIHQGKVYPLSIGRELDIVFHKENKGRFYFTGEVINRMERGNFKVAIVKKVSDIKYFQRRDFFRFNIVLDMDLEIFENGDVVKKISAVSKDISGGGLRLITKEALAINTVVKCIIFLDDKIIEPFGKVTRCVSLPDVIKKYEVGVCFTGIDEIIRSKIISFIFKSQRKLRKKGLI